MRKDRLSLATLRRLADARIERERIRDLLAVCECAWPLQTYGDDGHHPECPVTLRDSSPHRDAARESANSDQFGRTGPSS